MDESADGMRKRRRVLDPEDFRRRDTAELHLAPASAPSVSTGFDSLDKAMPGILLKSQVTELVGPPATGKTALCCAASARAAQCGHVLFIETKAANIAERVRQFLHADNRTHHTVSTKAQGNIRIVDIGSIDELLDLLLGVLELNREAGAGLEMLVVDSFADLAASRVHGHPRENGLVAAASRLLTQVATRWQCCVLFTNTTVGGGSQPFKPALKATYGPATPHRILSLSRVQTDPSSKEMIKERTHTGRRSQSETGFVVFRLRCIDLPSPPVIQICSQDYDYP
jgi:predicted ATP-dependent serine protease